MAERNIYKGPPPAAETPQKPLGEYTVADQAKGFGIPTAQLKKQGKHPVPPQVTGGTWQSPYES